MFTPVTDKRAEGTWFQAKYTECDLSRLLTLSQVRGPREKKQITKITHTEYTDSLNQCG